MPACSHNLLLLQPSRCADEVGYRQATGDQRVAATQALGRGPDKGKTSARSLDKAEVLPGPLDPEQPPPPSSFPAPLVLPGDELAYESHSSPQSLRSWSKGTYRNALTTEKKTIYVIGPPTYTKNVAHAQSWTETHLRTPKRIPKGAKGLQFAQLVAPKLEEVQEYLQAFYHGLPVKALEKPQLQFTSWDEEPPKKRTKTAAKPSYIGLSTGTELIRIRSRPSRDGLFAGQLNLNDLLDVAMSILPKDAYALLMLVDHDLYEDEEDDFCCGRAYGGSRVAVVSTTRYNPQLDERQGVDRQHAWPASHCQSFVNAFCDTEGNPGSAKKKAPVLGTATDESTALGAAVNAFSKLKSPSSVLDLETLWLGRVCKTASHEIGHCFGLGHCVYYACVMQGTAGLAEDARQPPYLCPVDMAKLMKATAESRGRPGNGLTSNAELARYDAVRTFCEKRKNDRLFGPWAAWLLFVGDHTVSDLKRTTIEINAPLVARARSPTVIDLT